MQLFSKIRSFLDKLGQIDNSIGISGFGEEAPTPDARKSLPYFPKFSLCYLKFFLKMRWPGPRTQAKKFNTGPVAVRGRRHAKIDEIFKFLGSLNHGLIIL